MSLPNCPDCGTELPDMSGFCACGWSAAAETVCAVDNTSLGFSLLDLGVCAECGKQLLEGVDVIQAQGMDAQGGRKQEAYCSQYCYRRGVGRGFLCVPGRKPGTPRPDVGRQAKQIAILCGVDWTYAADAEEVLDRVLATLRGRIQEADECQT